VGNEISVVTDKQLRDGGYRDVAQALERTTPGLYLSPTYGPFSYTDISLQGSRRNDVLWVVDGVRINNRLYATTSPNDTIPAAMVERIEVLKDGQGLYYGTQSVGGVINVVTRGFSDSPDGQVSFGGDTNSSYDTSGYYRTAIGPHKIVAYASYDRSEGITPFLVMQPSVRDRKRGYEVRTVGGKYGYEFSSDLSFTAGWQHTNAAVEQFDYTEAINHSANRRDEEIITARVDYTPDGPAQFFIKAYLHDWDTRYTTTINDGTPPYTPFFDYNNAFWGYLDYGVNALAKLALTPAFDTYVGYDFQNYKARDEVYLIDGLTETVHALFAQIRTTDALSTKAHFGLGARYNRGGEGQGTTVWNASGRYDLTPTLFVESVVGTAFRLPDASELYAHEPGDPVGNPELKGEKSTNVNLSIGGLLGESSLAMNWRLTGFYRKVKDLIDAEFDGSPDDTYFNTDGAVVTRGAEVQLNAQFSRALAGSVGYTYARVRAEGSDLQLARIPQSYLKAALTYESPGGRFGAGSSVYWLGDRFQSVSGFGRLESGNYALLDLNAHLRLGSDNRQRINARLENVFDKEYATLLRPTTEDGTGDTILNGQRGVPRTLHVSYSINF
jgi:vitamin B12 transporter